MRIATFLTRLAFTLAACTGAAHAQSTSYDGLDRFLRPSPATPADEIRVAYADQCGRGHPDNRAPEIEQTGNQITVTLYLLEASPPETCTAPVAPPVERTTDIGKFPVGQYAVTRILRARTTNENSYRTVDTRQETLVVDDAEDIVAILPAQPLALETLTAYVPVDTACERVDPITLEDDALVVTVRRVRFGAGCATARETVGVTIAALPAGTHRVVVRYRDERNATIQLYERTVVVTGVTDADALTNSVDYSGLWTFPGRGAGVYFVHAVGAKDPLTGKYGDLIQGRLLGSVPNGPDAATFALEATPDGYSGRLIPPNCPGSCIDTNILVIKFDERDPNRGLVYIVVSGVPLTTPLPIERFRWMRPSAAGG